MSSVPRRSRQRGAVAQHLARQCVSKLMGAHRRGLDAGALEACRMIDPMAHLTHEIHGSELCCAEIRVGRCCAGVRDCRYDAIASPTSVGSGSALG